MDKPKLRVPKFHIKVEVFLSAIFLLFVVMELFLLYKYLFLDPKKNANIHQAEPTPILRINFESSAKAKKWFEDVANYTLPPYSLLEETTGRENPFAQ